MAQAYDAESIAQRAITNLSGKTSWSDIVITSTNRRLIDLMAEMIAESARFAEYNLREAKWSLAQNISSLITQSRNLNYKVNRKIGSKGTLKISTDELFSAPYSANIGIPQYTTFSVGDIKVCNLNAETLTTIDNFIEMSSIQGFPRTFTYNAIGAINESFIVNNDSIDNDEYFLTVDGDLWTEISDLRLAGPTDKVYSIRNKLDFSGIEILTGNDINGRKLINGQTVVFTYIETLGSDGLIGNLNIVNTVDDTILDENGQIVELFVTNTTAISGGQNEEDIESIRANAPLVYQAGDRASTPTDYKIILITEIDYIQNANVWGSYEYNIDQGLPPWTFIPSQENLIRISAITQTGDALTTAQQLEVSEVLNELKSPIDIITFIDVSYINMKFTVNAFIRDRSYTLSAVKSDILLTLQDTYSIANGDFFKPVFNSDLQALIDGIAGVDYHNTTLSFFLETVFDSAYLTSYTAALPPLKEISSKIFIKDTTATTPEFIQVGIDDGAGNFNVIPNSLGVTDLTGSSTNYNTGESILNVTGLALSYLSYEIKVEWEIVSSNAIPTERNQYLIYGDADITVAYTVGN